MASFLLSAVWLFALAAASVNGLSSNKDCGRYGSANYTVIKTNKEFEVREYPAYNYAKSATLEGQVMVRADKFNIMVLARYFYGHNEGWHAMPMTTPAITPILEDERGSYKEKFSMLLWIPDKFQGKPPTPFRAVPEEQIEVQKWGKRIAYVRTYDGFAIEHQIMYYERELRNALAADGIVAGVNYDDKTLYSVVYYHPKAKCERKNEIMVMKTQD